MTFGFGRPVKSYVLCLASHKVVKRPYVMGFDESGELSED